MPAQIPQKNLPGRYWPTTQAATELSGLVKKTVVANALSVSCRSIENWMREKRIPFIRLSDRCVRFYLPSVLAALGKFEIKEIQRPR